MSIFIAYKMSNIVARPRSVHALQTHITGWLGWAGLGWAVCVVSPATGSGRSYSCSAIRWHGRLRVCSYLAPWPLLVVRSLAPSILLYIHLIQFISSLALPCTLLTLDHFNVIALTWYTGAPVWIDTRPQYSIGNDNIHIHTMSSRDVYRT